jgi:hypothetical protein
MKHGLRNAMPTKPSDPFIPSWSQDQLDSPSPPEEAAYFDHLLNAWVLSKHADILAAFRASSLAPTGPHQRKTVEPSDESGRAKMRAETMESLSDATTAWREQITHEVHGMADSFYGFACIGATVASCGGQARF